ncbi:MAG: SDR family NAD(P)-dependent oxidoreductase [Chthoniobacterales bacterium]|nr:SDR family NAD(P)-dependent oxidoreductase [Chthoniobacterales bacterium]
MKRIFLTGASAGIGLATAKLLVAQGHQVWGTSRHPSRLPSLGGLHPLRMDLAEEASVREAFESAWREGNGIDVLINNAGGGHFDTAESLPIKKVEELFRTLVFSHMELCRLALVAMTERQSGLIVNVTSLASRLPVPCMAAYNAAKAAMASYTFTLQVEQADRRVRIVDLQPGDICTSFNDSIARTPTNDARVAKAWEVVDRNMRQAPKPEFVARRILRLIDSANPPPRETVGDVFQSRIAPLIFRFLPQRVRIWGLKKYYGI